MGNITIKSPVSDDIWDQFKRKHARDIEKYFAVKGAVFKLEDVPLADHLKELQKHALIAFDQVIETKPIGKPKQYQENINKIAKTRWFIFGSDHPVKKDWKYEEQVPSFASLSPTNCPKCGGKGGQKCRKCGGSKFMKCPDCDGKKSKCKQCNGSGKIEKELEVINSRGDREKKTLTIKCQSCLGNPTILCPRCGGNGKILCTTCGGSGLDRCGECDGTGSLYRFNVIPVPFLETSTLTHEMIASTKLSNVEKEIGKDLEEILKQVEGIRINNPDKELDQRFIEPNLGYMNKDIKKMLNEIQKRWKSMDKSKDQKIRTPLLLIPLEVLYCVTPKGRKFTIYSIGTEKSFFTFGQI
jgi:hypothetical protein